MLSVELLISCNFLQDKNFISKKIVVCLSVLFVLGWGVAGG
jgi:hypothetical protein